MNNPTNAEAVLRELAERASAKYNRSVEAWIACAYILAEARELAGHGEWGAFVDETGIPERTVRRMIRIARAGLQIGHVADLGGVRAADEYLSLVDRAIDRWRSALAETEADTPLHDALSEAEPKGPGWAAIWLHANPDDWSAIMECVRRSSALYLDAGARHGRTRPNQRGAQRILGRRSPMNEGRFRVSIWSQLPGPNIDPPDRHAVDQVREHVGWYGPRYFDDEAAARAYAKELEKKLIDLRLDFPVLVVLSSPRNGSAVRVVQNLPHWCG